MKRVLDRDDIPAEVLAQEADWQRRRASFEPARHAAELYAICQEIQRIPEGKWQGHASLRYILAKYPKNGKGFHCLHYSFEEQADIVDSMNILQ